MMAALEQARMVAVYFSRHATRSGVANVSPSRLPDIDGRTRTRRRPPRGLRGTDRLAEASDDYSRPGRHASIR